MKREPDRVSASAPDEMFGSGLTDRQQLRNPTWLLRSLHNQTPLFNHHKMPSAEIFHFEKNINNQTGSQALLAASPCCWTVPRGTLLSWRFLIYYQLPCGGDAIHEVGRELSPAAPQSFLLLAARPTAPHQHITLQRVRFQSSLLVTPIHTSRALTPPLSSL